MTTALACAFFLAGCSTIKDNAEDYVTNPEKIQKVSTYIKSATAIGVSAVTSGKPELKKYMLIAAEAVGIAIQDEMVDPITIHNEVITLVTKKGGGAYMALIQGALTTALEVYNEFYESNWEKHEEALPALKTFLSALIAGIKEGAGTVAASGNGSCPSSCSKKCDTAVGSVDDLEKPSDEDLTLR
jgi:hypothetical protein